VTCVSKVEERLRSARALAVEPRRPSRAAAGDPSPSAGSSGSSAAPTERRRCEERLPSHEPHRPGVPDAGRSVGDGSRDDTVEPRREARCDLLTGGDGWVGGGSAFSSTDDGDGSGSGAGAKATVASGEPGMPPVMPPSGEGGGEGCGPLLSSSISSSSSSSSGMAVSRKPATPPGSTSPRYTSGECTSSSASATCHIRQRHTQRQRHIVRRVHE
jgi:hypothetical protein